MNSSFFPPSNPKSSIPDDEQHILKFWEQDKTFQRTLDERSEKFPYKFFDGPPFATGTPHYGHILAGTIKDAIPRYWTMKGYRVDRKWGWDCHGVPVEFQVEKENKIGGKPGIEKMGVGNFNELCRSVVLRCAEQWKKTVARMGRFVDFENDYKTMDPEFMESVWWVFGELYKKGLIYEGEKVVAYSPKLGSPLSNFEANLNYCDIDDPAVTVRFKVLDGSEKNYFLAWTTTPWTLPCNVALGFGRETEYSLVTTDDANYWVATALIEAQFGAGATVIKTEIGKNMAGMRYQPLFDFFTDTKPTQKRFVTLHDDGDYVSTDSGTGIVHFAPSFGLEDAELCDKWDIEGVNPIDETGYFDFMEIETLQPDADTAEIQGKYFRADPEVEGSKENNANDWVIKVLKAQGDLFRRDQIRHSYPHCWRTDCALMYRGVETWFVNVQKIKKTMLEENQKINWLPDHLRDGRFGNLLESAPDWAISRNRYWGCPIPAWKCDITGKVQVVTSRQELEDLTGTKVDDIHKHFVDDLTWASPYAKNGKMVRVPEVLDCWFESGAMPYGSIHYPFAKETAARANKTTVLPEQELFPLRNKFWVIRHGESENNVQEIYNCSLENKDEFALTAAGKKQVEVNAKASFQDQKIDVVVSSPFRRCQETAAIIAKQSGAEVIIDEDLREIHLGSFDQKAHRCFAGDDPRVPTGGETGESLAVCQDRMIELLKRINKKYKNKNIILVSHGGPIAALLQWINREPLAWPGRNKGTVGIPKNGEPAALKLFELNNLNNNYLVIRHSQSEKNFSGIELSSIERSKLSPLTTQGRADAHAEAAQYTDIDLIVTSPLLRAEETASIFAKALGKDVIVDARLTEIDLGDLDGAHRSEVVSYHKNTESVLIPFPNGESRLDVRKRLQSLLTEYESQYKHQKILFVTHSGPTEILVDCFLGRPLAAWRNYIPKCQVFDLQNESLEQKISLNSQQKILENIHAAKRIPERSKILTFIQDIWKKEFNLDVDECCVTNMFYLEQDDAIVGAIDFCESDPGIWKICHLVIEAGSRKQKFGSHLLNVSLDHLRDQQAKQLFVKAEVNVIGFYEKMGFQKISNVKRCQKNPTIEYFDMMFAFVENEDQPDYFQSADFIAEGLDQTRGWFYTLHVLGCALFGKRIFKNVITNGIVLAEDGQKMSKSKKNYPDPNIIFDKYGADAMRFYLLSSPVVHGENFRFTERGVEEVLKSIILPLKSAYNFLSTYANIDDWQPTTFQFIRHGEGAHNVKGIYSGQPDNNHRLTPLGREQVAATAALLLPADVIISSPFIRTCETAEIAQMVLKKRFGDRVPTEILFDERVQEPFFGDLEGQTLIPTFKRLANKTTENIDSIQDRMQSFLTDMTQQHRGKNILVTSHGSPIRHAECWNTRIDTIWDAVRLPYCPTGSHRTMFADPLTDNTLDQWILSELQTLTGLYHKNFETYDLEGALKYFAPFIDKLNNWYLRRSRRRFWANGMNNDKRSGYETLHHVLFVLSKLLAPVCPFFAEKMYQDLGGIGSVHLEYIPYVSKSFVRNELEQEISLTREIVGLAAGIRARAKIKLRQPLAKLQFLVSSDTKLDLEVIKAEANVKEVEILTEAQLATFAQKIIRVNARKVGKKFGKKVQELIKAGKLGAFKILDNGHVEIAGELLEADEYEVGFVTAEGVEAEATHQSVVLLDTVITEPLEIEGYSRELVRAIQDLRKKSGFDIADRIVVSYYTDSDTIKRAFTEFGTAIASEVLAADVVACEPGETILIDEQTLTLHVQKYEA